MFIRKKKNRSGSTSVVVVSKHNGKYREIHTIGVSKDEGEIALYTRQGYDWIANNLGEQDLFTSHHKKIEEQETAYKSGKLTKGSINKRGYNKFLEISDDVTVKICEEKIHQDQKWDGLKGYITNTDLPAKEVYKQYSSLWEVERAFRITKGTIELRPMFHFSPKRIEAHICICFAAYKIYKELERVLRISDINLSVDRVIDIAKTITTISVKLPQSGETVSKTMFLTERQKQIEILYQDAFWNAL